MFGTRESGQGKDPALTFIKETRWVAQDAAASPEAKQGWRPTTWPCFALSCSLSPRILLVATKAQAEGALGDWMLLLIFFFKKQNTPRLHVPCDEQGQEASMTLMTV